MTEYLSCDKCKAKVPKKRCILSKLDPSIPEIICAECIKEQQGEICYNFFKNWIDENNSSKNITEARMVKKCYRCEGIIDSEDTQCSLCEDDNVQWF